MELGTSITRSPAAFARASSGYRRLTVIPSKSRGRATVGKAGPTRDTSISFVRRRVRDDRRDSSLRGERSFSHGELRFRRSAQFHDRDLRKRAEAEWDAPIAGAGIDVEQRVAGPVAAHRVFQKRR